VDEFLRNFSLHLTADLREGFTRQAWMSTRLSRWLPSSSAKQSSPMNGRRSHRSSTTAAVRDETGFDPTVQYALGFDAAQSTWWTNPLSTAPAIRLPLQYLHLHRTAPGPIANPSLSALQGSGVPGGNALLTSSAPAATVQACTIFQLRSKNIYRMVLPVN
jgi:hypothetical protein